MAEGLPESGTSQDLGARFARMWGVVAASLALASDRATERWLLTEAVDPPRATPVTPSFNLVPGRNRGVGFGLLEAMPAAEAAVTPHLGVRSGLRSPAAAPVRPPASGSVGCLAAKASMLRSRPARHRRPFPAAAEGRSPPRRSRPVSGEGCGSRQPQPSRDRCGGRLLHQAQGRRRSHSPPGADGVVAPGGSTRRGRGPIWRPCVASCARCWLS